MVATPTATPTRMGRDCCATELDHCHGTLVVHDSGLVECELTGCTTLDQARHAVVLDCIEVDGTCICGVAIERELALAS